MDSTLRREEMELQTMIAGVEQQTVVEGEVALPGSMRDAATVLVTQANVVPGKAVAQTDQVSVSGQVIFHVLYSQGDLTRIQEIETNCDFTDVIAAEGVNSGMQAQAQTQVLEATSTASGGRLHLRAVIGCNARVYANQVVSGIGDIENAGSNVRARKEQVSTAVSQEAGSERMLLREEFDLPAALGVGETLFATARVHTGEISGGQGRASLSGVIDMCVYHAGVQGGKPLEVTHHSMPFEAQVDVINDARGELSADVQVRDVLADSMDASDGARILRVEIELDITLYATQSNKINVLEDAYTLEGEEIALSRETFRAHTGDSGISAHESGKAIISIPDGAEPIGTVLAAFAQPVLGTHEQQGERVRVDGVMDITLVYLPMDSDIPVSASQSTPFSTAFSGRADGDTWIALSCDEVTGGKITSDRAEVRYGLNLQSNSSHNETVSIVTQMENTPERATAGGVIVYYPTREESLWDVAKRYRVDEAKLSEQNGNIKAVSGDPILIFKHRKRV